MSHFLSHIPHLLYSYIFAHVTQHIPCVFFPIQVLFMCQTHLCSEDFPIYIRAYERSFLISKVNSRPMYYFRYSCIHKLLTKFKFQFKIQKICWQSINWEDPILGIQDRNIFKWRFWNMCAYVRVCMLISLSYISSKFQFS